MTKLLLLCILAHILGDYYFQTERISNKKIQDIKWLVFHSLMYTIPWIILAFFNTDKQLFILFSYLVLSHFIIDLFKYLIVNYFSKKEVKRLTESKLYVADQFLHLTCIFFISYFYFYNKQLEIDCVNIIHQIFLSLNINITNFIKLVTLTLILYKPTNITFGMLFSKYKPIEKRQYCIKSRNTQLVLSPIEGIEQAKILEGRLYESTSDIDEGKHCVESIKSAGAYIGFFERILVVIFIYLKAYSALGFVVTAKSVARYDNIVKNQKFAEYFLIGTLYSITISLLIYCILFYIL